MPDNWIVDYKGGPGEVFEISVLRSSNTHGIESYGWFGPDKLFISSSGGPCHNKVSPEIWHMLLGIAYTHADYLNNLEVIDAE